MAISCKRVQRSEVLGPDERPEEGSGGHCHTHGFQWEGGGELACLLACLLAKNLGMITNLGAPQLWVRCSEAIGGRCDAIG